MNEKTLTYKETIAPAQRKKSFGVTFGLSIDIA